MVHAQILKPGLARILEPPDIARARDAVFIIAVDRDGIAPAIGNRGDRALVVGEQEAAFGCADPCALEPHLRRICALPMHIALEHIAPLVIFRDQRIAVVKEPAELLYPVDLPQAAERVIRPSPAQIRDGPAAHRRLTSR